MKKIISLRLGLVSMLSPEKTTRGAREQKNGWGKDRKLSYVRVSLK